MRKQRESSVHSEADQRENQSKAGLALQPSILSWSPRIQKNSVVAPYPCRQEPAGYEGLGQLQKSIAETQNSFPQIAWKYKET